MLGPDLKLPRLIFVQVAGVSVLLAIVLRLNLHPENSRSLEQAVREPLALALAGAAICMAILQRLLPPLLTPALPKDLDQAAWIKMKFVPFLVSIALCDTIAILGFLTGTFTKNFEIATPFFALAFFFLFFLWPTKERWARPQSPASAAISPK